MTTIPQVARTMREILTTVADAAALKRYVKWALTEGQAFNESLGYVRLAPPVVARAVQAVESIR